MEKNLFEPWSTCMEKMEDLPRMMMETTHRAIDPLFEMVNMASAMGNGMWTSWEKRMGAGNLFFKWPMEWMLSNRTFMASYEKAETSLQNALKEEVDYWFAGQKKLRQTFFHI